MGTWIPTNLKLMFHRCQFCGRLQDNPKFWRKVNKLPGRGACWIWIGAKMRGYGVFTTQGDHAGVLFARRYLAHRFSLELSLGRPIAERKHALHHCDNPSCVRPSHLYEGTHQDNMRDCLQRGRFKVPDRRGEQNGRHKLTASQVAQIRALYVPKSTDTNQYTLAQQFHVSRSTIRALLSGPNWKRSPRRALATPTSGRD